MTNNDKLFRPLKYSNESSAPGVCPPMLGNDQGTAARECCGAIGEPPQPGDGAMLPSDSSAGT
jgi:hypothetical protein